MSISFNGRSLSIKTKEMVQWQMYIILVISISPQIDLHLAIFNSLNVIKCKRIYVSLIIIRNPSKLFIGNNYALIFVSKE